MFALVDANNFYASCEKVFAPQLAKRPVIVLSNNDGCVIARSAEAKTLGVPMCAPFHTLKDTIQHHGVVVKSSNYALYGDMSRRINQTLRQFAPHVEEYSIDESFLDLNGMADLTPFAQELRARLLQWTGIPCSIGLGPTKTLAKVANHLAKQREGVFTITAESRLLDEFPVVEVWGIGRRWGKKLAALSIDTAAQFRDADPALIRRRFGVVLSRTQRELQGYTCLTLDEIEPKRQQILVSRSFGERITSLEDLTQAVATFTTRAAEKLRKRHLRAQGVYVFADTSRYASSPQYHLGQACNLDYATDDTRLLLQTARTLLTQGYRSGYRYKRAGVCLLDLVPHTATPLALLNQAAPRSEALMTTLDQINRRFGKNSAGFASQAWQPTPWQMRQAHRSPSYTTHWEELPVVR